MAAAWLYSDWITLTDSTRLPRLALHMKEVSDTLARADTSMAGRSEAHSTQEKYLEGLQKQYAEMGGNMKRAMGRKRFLRADL